MFINDFMQYAGTSHGNRGNATEMAIKSYSAHRMVKAVRKAGQVDAVITFTADNGKRGKVTAEIKTGCGRIDNCADAQFVIYWAEPDLDTDVEHCAVVFTREQWHDFVNGYTGRGSFTKESWDGLHIQSFRGLVTGCRPKASLPIANYIYDTCDKMPTFAEWLEDLRG